MHLLPSFSLPPPCSRNNARHTKQGPFVGGRALAQCAAARETINSSAHKLPALNTQTHIYVYTHSRARTYARTETYVYTVTYESAINYANFALFLSTRSAFRSLLHACTGTFAGRVCTMLALSFSLFLSYVILLKLKLDSALSVKF